MEHELEYALGVLRWGRKLRESLLVGRLLSRILSWLSSAVLSATSTAATTATGLAPTTAPTADRAASDGASAGATAAADALAGARARKTGKTDDPAGAKPGGADDTAGTGSAEPTTEHAGSARVSAGRRETSAKTECFLGDRGRKTRKRARKPQHEPAGSETGRRSTPEVSSRNGRGTERVATVIEGMRWRERE